MRFGPLPPGRAVGAVLAHTLRLDAGTLRKGTVLKEEDARALEDAGIEEVTVAVLGKDDVGEDEAARRLARGALGPGLRIRGPFTGRCNVVAEEAGLVRVDEDGVRRANAVDEALTLATVHNGARVEAGDLVATAKVIPLGVSEKPLHQAVRRLEDAGPVLRLLPFRPRRAALVLTTLPGDVERLRLRAREVTERRLESLGSSLEATRTVPHEEEAVTRALGELRQMGCDLLLVLGASAVVDRQDVVPRAVERAGGRVHRLGIPVDPGNLLLLGSLDEAPVVGIPGCARSSRRSGFDTVLERLAAGVEPTAAELAELGVGGLLREIASRPQPRMAEPPGSGSGRSGGEASPDADESDDGRSRVAGLVLAAGRSRRMGKANKLLQSVDGVPMVAAVVDRLVEAGVAPALVVTGHEAEGVEAALEERPVRTVHNPRFDRGMGTSLAAGVAALPGETDGALVVLADMPRVSAGTLRALVEAFTGTDAGRPVVCVPVHGGKRGNPVLWGAAFFTELERLGGDVGGRALLDEHPEAVIEVAVDDPGVLVDVDTREALEHARRGGGHVES